MSEQKTFWQRLKNFTIWVCGIYAFLLICDFVFVRVTGQTIQTALTVVTYSNIVSTSRLDGCDLTHPCIDNRSQFLKQSSISSFRAIGSGAGNWSVDMQWADGTPTVWSTFGSTGQVNQSSPASGIGYGIGPSVLQKPYHDYIRFVMTGNVIILNYSGTRQFWWLPSVAAVAFPITFAQGAGPAIAYPQLYGALCNGTHDDTTAVQAALNSGNHVDFPPGYGACMVSATVHTTVDNQWITGHGAGNADATYGISILRALTSFNGPVLAILHYGTTIDGLTIDGNGGLAQYGVISACGANGRIRNSQIRGAASDNLRFTNTDAGYTTCENGAVSNDSMQVETSSIYGSIGGNGVNMTTQAGDINNNDIIFLNDQVNANYLNGGLLSGSAGKVIGGDWSNNGVNTDATQSYCIYLGPGTGASAVNWEIRNPDIETCNFNPVTGLYKGPQGYMGNFSQANVWHSAGQSSSFCNDAGCYIFSVGANVWKIEYTGGINQIVGTGAALPNECTFDQYFTLPYPSWCIQNGVGGGIMTAGIHSGGGGSGYVVGNEVFVTQSGGSDGALTITAVDGGGAVTGFRVIGNPWSGQGYTTATGLATTGGTGTGLTVDITVPYVGHNLPIAYGLRNNYQGVVQIDQYGLETSVGNTQYSTCTMTVAANNIPLSCIHPIIRFQATFGGIALNDGPIWGEHHEICNGYNGTNSLDIQSHYLNLASGSVTGSQTNFFTAINQCLTVTFNGVGGLVNTSGSTFTWVYGSQFLTTWTGKVSINGGVYTISSCSTVTTCTTTAPIGSFLAVPFTGPGDWDVISKTF